MRVTDAIRIYENSRVDLAVSSTAAHSAVLSEGIYDIVSDVDCWVKIAPTADDVTVAAVTQHGAAQVAREPEDRAVL